MLVWCWLRDHTRFADYKEPSVPFILGTTRRIGVAIRYCGAYIKQKEDIGDSAMLACGKDHGTFKLEPKPEREWGENEIKAHQEAVGPVGPQERIDVK